MGEAEATRVLQEFDRNKDGVLSLDEFRRLVQQRQRAAAPLSPGFFGGLEAIVGAPNPLVREAMKLEHTELGCDKAKNVKSARF